MREGGIAWADHAHRSLRDGGHRVGGARERVIAVLAERGGGLSAFEILDALGAERRIAFSSIYRSLAALVHVGALRAIDLGGVARYGLVTPGGDQAHHLVCHRCGRTDTFQSEPMEALLAAVASGSSYDVDRHDVILHGLCPDCAARHKQAA